MGRGLAGEGRASRGWAVHRPFYGPPSKFHIRSPRMFSDDLQHYGPHAAAAMPLTLRQSRRYCRRLACRHYENFTVASRLLPRRLRQHVCNLYAYCRWADDLADELPIPSKV